MATKWCKNLGYHRRGALLFIGVIHQISRSHRLKNQRFESNSSKITRSVAAIKIPQICLVFLYVHLLNKWFLISWWTTREYSWALTQYPPPPPPPPPPPFVAYSAPSHYLNQCWIIYNWPPRNKFQLNFTQNTKLFIHDNVYENIDCGMAAILSVRGYFTKWWHTPYVLHNLHVQYNKQMTSHLNVMHTFGVNTQIYPTTRAPL